MRIKVVNDPLQFVIVQHDGRILAPVCMLRILKKGSQIDDWFRLILAAVEAANVNHRKATQSTPHFTTKIR